MKEIRELTPGQDFQDGVAYTCFSVKRVTGNRISDKIEIISSTRKHFELTDENLFDLGFYTERTPFIPKNRWSKESISSFLNSNQSPDIKEVFESIKDQFEKYIDLPDKRYYSFFPMWIIGTYFHRLFSTYPYVHLNGRIATGKTKTLTLISLLAFNGELSFHSTPSYVTRAIHNNHSVLCVDEAENLKGNSVLVSMLNAGYKKGVYTGKTERENGSFKPKLFEGYSPKTFASINGLMKSLSSRCIKIEMEKSKNIEIKNRELDMTSATFQKIRDNLYLLMMTKFMEIRNIYHTITDEEIQGRNWELWKPILTIAQMLDRETDSVYSVIREMAKDKMEIEQDETENQFILNMKNLIWKYPSKHNFYPTEKIISFLKTEHLFRNINGKSLSILFKKSDIPVKPIQKKLNHKIIRGYFLNYNFFRQ